MLRSVVIPIFAGLATMFVIDYQFGKISIERFEKIISFQPLYIAALYGAAYGANGAKAIPAAISIVVYMVLVKEYVKFEHKKRGKSDEDSVFGILEQQYGVSIPLLPEESKDALSDGLKNTYSSTYNAIEQMQGEEQID